MPLTFSLITSTTLTSTTANVTLSGIPATFTDLYVVSRNKDADVGITRLGSTMRMNSNSSSNYDSNSILANGGTLTQRINTSITNINNLDTAGSSTGAWSCWEMYIFNYTSTSAMKTLTTRTGVCGPSTTALTTSFSANMWNRPDAVGVLTFTAPSGGFATNSKFYVYGILRA